LFSFSWFNHDYVIASAIPVSNSPSSQKLALHEHVFRQFHEHKRLLFTLAGERRNTDERHRFPTSLIFWARPPN
ncbi:TPA: hypothetical protein ACNRKJ_001897, partial [Escherichia coli]